MKKILGALFGLGMLGLCNPSFAEGTCDQYQIQAMWNTQDADSNSGLITDIDLGVALPDHKVFNFRTAMNYSDWVLIDSMGRADTGPTIGSTSVNIEMLTTGVLNPGTYYVFSFAYRLNRLKHAQLVQYYVYCLHYNDRTSSKPLLLSRSFDYELSFTEEHQELLVFKFTVTDPTPKPEDPMYSGAPTHFFNKDGTW